MRLGFSAIALFLFIVGIIAALTGDDASVGAIFNVGGWIVFAIGMSERR